MEIGNMMGRASHLAPIEVDRDSDETLSSDDDVEMAEEDADFEITKVTPRLRTPAATSPSTPTQPIRHSPTPSTSTLNASLAAARGNLLSMAAAGNEDIGGGGGDTRGADALKTNGKKRRLNPSPSASPIFSQASQSKATAPSQPVASSPVLNFYLPRGEKQTQRAIQFSDYDRNRANTEEETKGNDASNESPSSNVSWIDSTKSSMKRSSTDRIEAGRTWICGQWFGKCVLEFHAIYVALELSTLPSRDGSTTCAFSGSVMCRQLERFSLSKGNAPYFAILQLANRVGFSPAFAEFCDETYARVTEQNGPSIEPNINGVILFFDDALDLTRCRSLGEVSPQLRVLVEEPISSDEVAQIRALKEASDRNPSAAFSSTNVFSLIGGKVKGTLNMISALFSPDRSPKKTKHRQAKLPFETAAPGSGESSDADSKAMSSRFRTSSRRKSLLQQRSPRDNVEVVVQLSGGTDSDSGDDKGKEKKETSETKDKSSDMEKRTAERRSTRGVLQLQRQHHLMETERLAVERKSKILLTYPFDEADRPGQITITLGDIDRLKPGEFLNDSIIDFYLRYLWRHMEPWQRSQVYFFSSHFFTHLSGGKISGNVTLTEERLRRISRWTQKENLFEKRFLFVPINDSCHWSIVVICNPSSAIIHKRRRTRKKKPDTIDGTTDSNRIDLVDVDAEGDATVIDTTEDASDSEEEESLQKERLLNPPCVLFLDSLRCHPKKKICNLLKSYLEYEFKTRIESSNGETAASSTSKGVSTVATFDAESMKMIEPQIPLQSNSSDCGVFLLMYTEQILLRFPAGLNFEDVASKLVSSVSKQMFDEGHVQEFRDYLHQLIFILQKIERRGGSEHSVRTEGLDFFAIES